MKKVIFQMSVSLDGYIEGPNHEIDWHLVDDEFNSYAMEMLKAGTSRRSGEPVLFGRVRPTTQCASKFVDGFK